MVQLTAAAERKRMNPSGRGGEGTGLLSMGRQSSTDLTTLLSPLVLAGFERRPARLPLLSNAPRALAPLALPHR